MKSNVYALLIFLILSTPFAKAESLEQQEKALKLISNFSDEICTSVPLTGKTKNLKLTANAKLEFKGILQKITSLGINPSVQYKTSNYEGILQKDLPEILKYNINCKEKVSELLIKKLLFAPSISHTTRISHNTINRENQLKHVNQQINDFYYPLNSLLEIGRQKWINFRTKWGNDREFYFKHIVIKNVSKLEIEKKFSNQFEIYQTGTNEFTLRPKMNEKEKKAWVYFIKSNADNMQKIENLIIDKGNLQVSDPTFKNNLTELTKHIEGYKIIIAKWNDGDYSEYVSVNNFPKDINNIVKLHLQQLIEKRNILENKK